MKLVSNFWFLHAHCCFVYIWFLFGSTMIDYIFSMLFLFFIFQFLGFNTYIFKIINTDICPLGWLYSQHYMFIYILGANESAFLYLKRWIWLTPKKRGIHNFLQNFGILKRNFNFRNEIKWGIWFGIACGNTRFSVSGWSIIWADAKLIFINLIPPRNTIIDM